MDVNSLILFARIVEDGNLSAAARTLNMTRSSVSRRLKGLEKAVHVPLLVRSTHEICLTPAGKVLYQRARNILRETEAARSELFSSSEKLGGRVKVVLPRSLASAGLAEVITDFGIENPDVELNVKHAHEITDLYSSWTDIAVHIAPRPIETAVNLLSYPLEWCVCVSPSYIAHRTPIIEPKDLYQHPIICYAVRDGKIPLQVRAPDYQTRLMLSPHISTNDLKFVLTATINGLGVGLIPQFMIKKHTDANIIQKRLNNYEISYMRSKVCLQTMDARYQTPAARALARRIKSALQSFVFSSLETKAMPTSIDYREAKPQLPADTLSNH